MLCSLTGMSVTTLTSRATGLVLGLAAFLIAGFAPAQAQDERPTSFGPRIGLGVFDVGVAVAPRRPSFTLSGHAETSPSATPLYRLGQTELTTTDIGVDLRLKWPTTTTGPEPAVSMVQPYVSLGPSVAVPVGEEPLVLSRQATKPGPALSLGMRGTLGLMWRIAPDASVFGEYRLIQDRQAGSRTSHDSVDLFYGFSLRF